MGNNILLEMDVSESGLEFTSSINSAMNRAYIEMQALDETIDSIKILKPECDQLDYILATGSGALCGIIDIFLLENPEKPH